MLKSQVVADLAILISSVSGPDRAQDAIHRALRLTSLTHAVELSQSDLYQLLAALCAEGGQIEAAAMDAATLGMAQATALHAGPTAAATSEPSAA